MTQFEIPAANIVFAEFMGERRRNLELDENKSGYHYDTDYD